MQMRDDGRPGFQANHPQTPWQTFPKKQIITVAQNGF